MTASPCENSGKTNSDGIPFAKSPAKQSARIGPNFSNVPRPNALTESFVPRTGMILNAAIRTRMFAGLKNRAIENWENGRHVRHENVKVGSAACHVGAKAEPTDLEADQRAEGVLRESCAPPDCLNTVDSFAGMAINTA